MVRRAPIAILLGLLWFCGTVAAQGDASLRGTLLVADASLSGSSFAQTVILIIENNAQGSLGVTLNRGSDVRLSQVLPDEPLTAEQDYPVFAGGPVRPRQLGLLLRGEDEYPDMDPILPGVRFTADAPAFDAVIGDTPAPDTVRIFSGYSGWAPGQLESEIENGAWHILPSRQEYIFSENHESLWRRLHDEIQNAPAPGPPLQST